MKDSHDANWLILPPAAFAAAYSAFVVVYTTLFGSRLSQVAFIGIAAGLAAAAVCLGVIARRLLKSGSKMTGWEWAASAFAVVWPFSRDLFLGTLPLLVSDQWGHMTMANRLLIDDSTVLIGAHVPGTAYAQTFAPHHAFLASLCMVTGLPLEIIWRIASSVLSSLLLLSFASFCRILLPENVGRGPSLLFLTTVFAVFFPICMMLVAGPDYRLANSILLFLAGALAWRLEAAHGRIARTSLLVFLTSIMALTHMIEVMILGLMFGPYVLARALMTRSIGTAAAALTWGAASLAMLIVAKAAYYSDVDAPLQYIVSWSDYRDFHLRMIGVHVGWWPLVMAVGLLPFVFAAFPRLGLWGVSTLAASTLLSPLNPLLTAPMSETVSVSLVWRTAFVFPVYLFAPIGVIAAFLIAERTPVVVRRTIAFAAVTTFLVVAGVRVWTALGLQGGFSYYRSDANSQPKLWPHLFKFLKAGRGEVILSDMITSEPIGALTSHNVLLHRPWATDIKVFNQAQSILADPASEASCAALKARGVTMILVNRASLPPLIDAAVKANPSLRDGMYAPDSQYAAAPYLQRIDTLNEVAIYRFSGSCPAAG